MSTDKRVYVMYITMSLLVGAEEAFEVFSRGMIGRWGASGMVVSYSSLSTLSHALLQTPDLD